VDDLDGSWGEGEPVEGRGIDLLMAACGRAALLDGAGRRRNDGTGRAREIPLSAVCHAPDSADRHLTHLLVGSDVG
jgi:hypothetical protein